MIGRIIRDIRLSKGLTQQNIAFELNMSLPGYSKIERGINDITFTRLVQIAQVFGMSVNDLILYGKEAPQENKTKAEIKQIDNNEPQAVLIYEETSFPLENEQNDFDMKDKEIEYLKKIIELLEEKIKILESSSVRKRRRKIAFEQ